MMSFLQGKSMSTNSGLPFREHDQQRHRLQIIVCVHCLVEVDLLEVLETEHNHFRPRDVISIQRHVEIAGADRRDFRVG
jgi:hypothetical protein